MYKLANTGMTDAASSSKLIFIDNLFHLCSIGEHLYIRWEERFNLQIQNQTYV